MLKIIVTDGEAVSSASLGNRHMQQVDTAAGAKAQIIPSFSARLEVMP